jgi:hypothetical protein
LIEEIFEKSGLIQRWRISIPFSVIADFVDPIGRFAVVEYEKESARIQEGPSSVVQKPKLAGFDADYGIWLPEGEIAIPRAFFLSWTIMLDRSVLL